MNAISDKRMSWRSVFAHCGLLLMYFGASTVCPAQNVEKRSTEQVSLDVRQAEKNSSLLRITLPKNGQPEDKLILVFRDPKGSVPPQKLMHSPEGKIDEAIRSALDVREKTGIDGDIHQIGTRFNNGTFDVVSTKNSHDSLGVYAVTNMSDKQTGTQLGAAATYFKLRNWKTDNAGVVEIVLPTSAPGSRADYIPRNCQLFLWIVDKEGKSLAHGKIDVVRK